MVFVGIDPGRYGAVAAINGEGSVTVVNLPDRGDGQLNVTKFNLMLQSLPAEMVIAVEKAQPFKNQGLASTGRYLKNYGKLLAVCELVAGAGGVKHPRPQMWQVVLPLMPGQGTKARALEFCKQFYPQAKLPATKAMREGCADAICIAHWLRSGGSGMIKRMESPA